MSVETLKGEASDSEGRRRVGSAPNLDRDVWTVRVPQKRKLCQVTGYFTW